VNINNNSPLFCDSLTDSWTKKDWALNLIPLGGVASVVYEIGPACLSSRKRTAKISEDFFKFPVQTTFKKIAQCLWVPIVACGALKLVCFIIKACWNRCFPAARDPYTKPELPEDIWTNHIIPMLILPAHSTVPLKQRIGKMQINHQMSESVKKTMLKLLESEHRSSLLKLLESEDRLLQLMRFRKADEAINFVVRYKLSSANLRDITDLTNTHLRILAEQCLQLRHLTISSLTVTEVPKFAALQSLDLRSCNALTDAGLAHLQEFTALQSLEIFRCPNLTGACFAHRKGLTALESLKISYCCNLTGAYFAHLKGFTALRSLELRSCPEITYEHLSKLKGLKALRSLTIFNCSNLTDSEFVLLQTLLGTQVNVNYYRVHGVSTIVNYY